MRKSHCYHSTKDKVELDLTQQEIIELHELCDYIIEVCDEYIKYLYKNFFDYVHIEDTAEFTRVDTKPSWKIYYKRYIKKHEDLLRIYLYEIANEFEHAFEASKYNGFIYTNFYEAMNKYCRKLYMLRVHKKSSDRLLVITPAHHVSLSRINDRGSITIPGFKKNISLRSEFKDVLGDDRVMHYFINITKPSSAKLMKASVNLGFGTKNKPYIDIDGFINLRKKKKGSKSNVWKKERID